MTRTPRGLTLVELVVAMAVSALVTVAIVAAVNAQQRAYYDGHRQRAAQSSARAAMGLMEEQLSLAGYGLDAPLAFDFDRYAGPCPSNMDPCRRDATNTSDEIVFYYRNPRYWVPDTSAADPRGNAWRIRATDGASITVVARAGDVFLQGQIVQAVCPAGATYAYGTVSDNTTAAANGDLVVPLTPPQEDDPFQRPDAMTDGCFAAGPGRVFLVERRRFHVRPVVTTAGVAPYLVMDMGVDANQDGTVDANDEVVIAQGVEILQFAYVMTSNALAPRGTAPGTQIGMARGTLTAATSGTALTLLTFPGGVPATGQTIYRPTSFYGYAVGPPPHDRRLTDHQANVRAVRMEILARSESPAPASDVRLADLVPVMNMDALPGWLDRNDHYARVRLVTTVPLRNMVSRAMPDF
jgi:type IV pilus assembly protein PilW